jgi:hypothetical protein
VTDPGLPTVTDPSLFPDEGASIPTTFSAAAPEPSPLPVFGQNATWLSRTQETGEVEPSFAEAAPPPPSPWEEGLERPEVGAAPQMAASTVEDTIITPPDARIQLADPAVASAPVDFAASFGDLGATPELLISAPSPTGNPAQSPMAVNVSDLPELTLEMPPS